MYIELFMKFANKWYQSHFMFGLLDFMQFMCFDWHVYIIDEWMLPYFFNRWLCMVCILKHILFSFDRYTCVTLLIDYWYIYMILLIQLVYASHVFETCCFCYVMNGLGFVFNFASIQNLYIFFDSVTSFFFFLAYSCFITIVMHTVYAF
jgi:hypothetical protein